MKVLLTGATGFVGSVYLRALLNAGHDVTLLLRESSDTWRIDAALQELAIKYVDFHDRTRLLADCASVTADVVTHFAWHGVPGGRKDDDDQLLINVPVMENVLALCSHVDAQTFVALGSQAEYGLVEGVISEHQATRPVTKYGDAKCRARELAAKYCSEHAIRFQWFRLFSLYGPDEREPWLIPSLVRHLVQEGSCALTSCEQIRDYLQVDDAAAAFLAALEHEIEGVFHVASGEGVPLRAIVEHVQRFAAPASDLGFGRLEQRSDQPRELIADIARMQAVTSWKPQVDLETGLKETVSSLIDEYQRPL